MGTRPDETLVLIKKIDREKLRELAGLRRQSMIVVISDIIKAALAVEKLNEEVDW